MYSNTIVRYGILFYLSVSSNPVAFFPLNGQYETTDASHSHNPSGKASNLESASWPDGNMGGSYQFWGNLTSFIQFPNLGGLDTRYSMTLLAWIYHEQIKGPILIYFSPGCYVNFNILQTVEKDLYQKKHVQKQNVWTYNFLHISIYYVYTRLSNYTNSKRHLLKKQRLKRSVLTGGRM